MAETRPRALQNGLKTGLKYYHYFVGVNNTIIRPEQKKVESGTQSCNQTSIQMSGQWPWDVKF